jgi:Tfp pilus assembly protein PilN
VTSLRQLPVRLPESLRQLLVLLDGTRDRPALAAGLSAQGATDSAARVERMLDELGRSAFLLA